MVTGWQYRDGTMEVMSMKAFFKMCGAVSLGWALPLMAGIASDISPAVVYDLSPSYLAIGLSVTTVGIIKAVQVADDNFGDGGTSVRLGGVGLLADGQMAGIEGTVTGSGVLAFDWKVSSEADWDVLRFYEVGGAVTNRISGTTGGWSRVYATINSASDTVHTFRWEYEKDPTGDYVGSDCGWVDAASWAPFYVLTVNGGNGDGTYTNGAVALIAADTPPVYYRFDRWTGDTNGVSDVLASSTTLLMPATGVVVKATYTPILYTLSVVNGSGAGSYSNGAMVAIAANAPPAHYEFNRWTGDTNGVANALASSTTLLILGTGTVVTATYKPIFYPVTVNNGTGSGSYTNGSAVTIAADTPPAHFTFDCWTGNTNCVTAVLLANTILTVPGSVVTITATFKPILYSVEVSGGLGNGSYAYGTQLDLIAAFYAGKRFYRWAGTTNHVADVNAPTTTVFIAGESLSLTSLYSVPLTVNLGTGGGWYPEGSTATVTANPDPLYKDFAGWTGDAAGLLSDAAARTTSVTMPTRSAMLTATYRDSIARVTGSYGRTYTTSGTSGGLSTDAAAGSPSGTPAVKLGGAGVVPDNGFAAFETVVPGSGTVTFWWKVSSESNADYLKFKVDGAQIAAVSGTKGEWVQVTNRVEGAGVNHTLRWEYTKNGSLSSSEDSGWVDDIVWSGDTPDPIIVSDIWSSLDADGLLTVGFIGERGLSYTLCTNASPDVCGWIAVDAVTRELQETNGVFRFEISAALPSGQSNFVCRIVGGNAFKVHFDPAGGTAATASANVLYGAAYGALPTATRFGYAFGGWWTGAGGTGKQIADTTTVEQKTEHTLYAMWTVTNLPPLITLRTPAANPVQMNEGASVAFSVTASDVTDPNAAVRGMSNITWYVDGVQKQETKTGAPNAITSAFTFKTDTNTVRGVAFLDLQVKAVALDKQGGTAETNWTVRVNNVPAAQAITFPALPVKVIGDTDFVTGAQVSSGLTIVYSNSNPAVVQVVGGVIHIVGAGTAVITAVQSGNFDFKAALPVKQTLTVKANLTANMPSGGGTVTGTGLYLPGTKVSLTAKPATGNTFLRWEDGFQTTSRSITMPNANLAVSAWFGPTTNVLSPVIAAPGAQQAMVGVFFTLPLEITSDSLPAVTLTGLPAGLAYNAATKTIAGVPSAAVSNKVVAVAAKNANKASGTNSFLVTVSPLSAWAQGTFSGTCALRGGAEPGAAMMTVTALGKISGTLSAAGTNYVFNAVSYTNDPVFAFTASAVAGKVGIPLAFVVTQAVGSAASALGVAAGRLAVTPDAGPLTVMYRNVWKDKDMSAVATNYMGYYTATLPGGSEYGSGYLTFTVDKSGGVKTAGKLADGTAVSLSGVLILDEAGRVFAVLYTAPAAYKGGGLFGVAEFFRTGVGAKVVVRPLDGEPFLWESLNPAATQVYGAGFSRDLGLSGGWYDTLGNLYGYYSNRVMTVGTEGMPVPETLVGTNRYDSVCWNPDGLELTVATNKLGVMTGFSAPKAGTPIKVGAAYDYTNPINTVGLSVALTRATGVFKGSFKAWFDYVTTHTSKSMAFEGVLTPERDDREDGVEGRGFFLWPDSGQYPNPQGKPVPYSFSWSYDLLLRAD